MKRQLFAVTVLLLSASAARLAAGTETPNPALFAWHNRAETAFAEARKSGKPVLVDLYAAWCGWCKTMEREVFSQERFQSYAERFVLLRVDVEDGGAGSELQSRFRANSLPTLLLLDPKQSLIGSIEGFMETEKLIARLDRELRTYDAFLAAYERTLASTDPGAWRQGAQELHARGDGGRAATLFEKVIRSGNLQGDELSWTKLQLADAYRLDGRFAEARKTASALRTALAGGGKTPQHSEIAERVDLLLLFIAGGERDCTGAAGALAEFERGHPRSPYLQDARRIYSALKSDTTAQCS